MRGGSNRQEVSGAGKGYTNGRRASRWMWQRGGGCGAQGLAKVGRGRARAVGFGLSEVLEFRRVRVFSAPPKKVPACI